MSSFIGKFKKSNEIVEEGPFEWESRTIWVQMLQRVAFPVLNNLKKDNLKKTMPFESKSEDRQKFSYFEAFSRVFNGIAPWLELGPDETDEGRIRENYINLTIKAISNALNSESNDHLLFTEPKQSLMDAAIFAQALLRSKSVIWANLSINLQAKIINELKNTRIIAPYENSWLLYTSIIEATLLEFTGECDIDRLTYGIKKFKNEWYLGDGEYSDGPVYNTDFYNSIIIHPMLIDILKVMKKYGIDNEDFLSIELMRTSRYASKLERMISPEGSFPLTGRSLTYRTGIFHTLAYASYLEILPKNLDPGQVRNALTKVLTTVLADSSNFDKKGWLKVGLKGNQLEMAENDVDTGSVYACAFIFAPLGLSFNDSFWSYPAQDWTSFKAFNGGAVEPDQTIDF